MKIGKAQNINRKAAFAGQFYPGDRKELSAELSRLFEWAQTNKHNTTETASEKKPQALISPHAGYIFSGKVAASAFNQIPDGANYKRIFVLASSHQYSFMGASVYTNGNYETPLGEIKVDKKLCKRLVKTSPLFTNHAESHKHEHSLEVQLPFLQHRLGNNYLLVPIIFGTNNANDCKEIAKLLKPFFTPENLFVISTDFSHYPTYSDANDIDKITANTICGNNPQELQLILEENKNRSINNLATSLCGWTSVITLLYITEKEDFSYKQINYQNSGDSKIYSDKKRVVGYWSIAIYEKESELQISETEKEEILEKAKHSINTFIKSGKIGNLIQPSSNTGILHQITGAFVSIYIKGELRGCIGGFAQDKTLNEMVQQMAKSAACDHRFEEIKPDDTEEMELEISVLTPLKKINSIDEIKLGRHGIFIEQGINSGTFLPQVAEKTGWTLKQFLGHCARDKARIGWDGWKTADIYTYEAVILKGK